MTEQPIALPQLVSWRAAQTPDAVAMNSADTGASTTWREVDEEARRWADAFRRAGVRAGDTVVTMMPNGFDAFSCWLGVAWLRAVEVPVNTSYRGEWLRHAVANAGATTALVAARFLDQLVSVGASLPSLQTVIVYDSDDPAAGPPFDLIGGKTFFDGAEPAEDLEAPEPWDVACIIYTSGTTGPSKGVVMPWGQLHASITSGVVPDELQHNAVVHAPFAPYHVTGKGPLHAAAHHDGRLVLREVFSIEHFWDDIHTYGCTAASLIGPLANFLYQQPARPEDATNPLKYVGMAPVTPTVDEFKERFGVEVFTAYSMTELNAPIISRARPITNANHRSCGRPRGDGIEVRVVDEHDYPVGPNVIGELVVRATEPWTMNLGYFNMPDKTVEAWRNGWFHTGDGFMYDDAGEWYFVDRVKDYIRRRGENISSFEVEGAVNQFGPVLESAAIAVPSEWGEDEVKVAVVPKPGEEVDPRALIEFLIPIMPRFAVPRYVEVVAELPKTPTLRIQKAKLRETALNESTWDREVAGVELPR